MARSATRSRARAIGATLAPDVLVQQLSPIPARAAEAADDHAIGSPEPVRSEAP